MELRRKDRAMSEAETLEILRNAEYGILAMTDRAGEPYAVPVNHALEGRTLYFHGALAGRKDACLRRGGKVCFTVVHGAEILAKDFTTRYESVVAIGTPRLLETQEEKAAGLRALIRKFSPEFSVEGEQCIANTGKATAVWAIDLSDVTGKANRS